jgi:hypothetical protein
MQVQMYGWPRIIASWFSMPFAALVGLIVALTTVDVLNGTPEQASAIAIGFAALAFIGYAAGMAYHCACLNVGHNIPKHLNFVGRTIVEVCSETVSEENNNIKKIFPLNTVTYTTERRGTIVIVAGTECIIVPKNAFTDHNTTVDTVLAINGLVAQAKTQAA